MTLSEDNQALGKENHKQKKKLPIASTKLIHISGSWRRFTKCLYLGSLNTKTIGVFLSLQKNKWQSCFKEFLEMLLPSDSMPFYRNQLHTNLSKKIESNMFFGMGVISKYHQHFALTTRNNDYQNCMVLALPIF